MKLIIAGSRTLDLPSSFIQGCVDLIGTDGQLTEIVEGGAAGVDWSGEQWARQNKIPVKTIKADWNKFGPKAGPLRNKEMAQYGDELLLIWNGTSKGSASMKKEMQKLNKPIYEVIIK